MLPAPTSNNHTRTGNSTERSNPYPPPVQRPGQLVLGHLATPNPSSTSPDARITWCGMPSTSANKVRNELMPTHHIHQRRPQRHPIHAPDNRNTSGMLYVANGPSN